MATVIDALLITLGFNASQFQQGTRQAQGQLTNFQNQAAVTAKNIQHSTQQAVQFFSQLRSHALGFFGTVLGVGGFEELVRHVVTTSSSIDKLSNRFDVSAEFLSKFGNVVKSVGGTVEEAQGFISELAEGVLQLNSGVKTDLINKLQSITGIAQAVGVQGFIGFKGGKADAAETAKNIGEVLRRATPEQRQIIAQAIGIPLNVFTAMTTGGGLAARLAAAPGIDKKLAEASQKLVEAFNNLQNQLTVFAAKGIEPLLGSLEQLFKLFDTLSKISGDEFLQKLFGIEPPGKEKPEVLFDLPAYLRSKGLTGLGNFLEGKEGVEDNLKKGIEMLKGGKGTPIGTPSTTGKTSSFGDVPIGLAAAANSMQDIPGFRITSTTGGTHAGTAHAEGRAMDFVVDAKYYDRLVAELRSRFEEEGLRVIDAHKKPDSRFWTGPHIHLEFATKAAAERFQQTHGITNTHTSETHIGEINVHAPSTDAGEITKKIDTTVRRSSETVGADTGFE